MEIFIAYTFALLCTTLFVLLKGERIGKWSVAVIWVGFISAMVATLMIRDDRDFLTAILTIEVISLISKIAIALMCDKKWPIIVAGLHLNTVSFQMSAALSPDYLSKALYGLSTVWAIPVLVVIVLGIILDRDWEQSRHGASNGAGVSH